MLTYEKTANAEINGIVETILSTVPVQEIYLFGSFANGTHKDDSDYDFYVVIPDGELRAIEATWKISAALRTIRNRPIDMLVGSESKFDKFKNAVGFIENEVNRTGLKLYG